MTEIKLDDLASTCAKCKGAGQFTEVYGNASAVGMGPTSYTGTCPECKGDGVLFTKSGEALKRFVQMLRSRGLIGYPTCASPGGHLLHVVQGRRRRPSRWQPAFH